MAAPKGNCGNYARRSLTPLERFRSFCQFEPETGCVLWTGAQTMGRGHHVPYGSFWADKRRWFAHRWSARFIHGLDIVDLHVDHCCPNIPLPNTLCVEHLQAVTLQHNRLLQFERRKRFIHLQVGLVSYEDIYGPEPPSAEALRIPFYSPPAWLGIPKDPLYVDCPF